MGLRFTMIGTVCGAAASVVVLVLMSLIFASGEPSTGGAAGAEAGAFLLATIAGLPFSLVFVYIAQGTSRLARLAIGSMPVANGALVGAVVEVSLAIVRSLQERWRTRHEPA